MSPLTSRIFAASLQGHTVLHLKDLIHIRLEPEIQGCGMTFNMWYDF